MKVAAPLVMKVMIIEENPSLRSMIRSILELGHADVAETSSGSQALSMYGSYQPDWVVVDMSLRESDGLSVTKRLRKIHPEARVMLMTDLDSLTLRQQARKVGVDGILVKETMFKDLERNDFQLLRNVQKDLKA